MSRETIRKAAVIGAGVMGHSIAQVFAAAGVEVVLVDLKSESLKRAMKLIRSNCETLAEFNRIRRDDIPKIVERIHTSTDLPVAVRDVDIVVEAVNEVKSLKKTLFRDLSRYCRKDTILASNTSGLNIYKFVKVDNPSRLIIHHWFAPPHIIPLVEVVPGDTTSRETIETSVDLLKKLGKRPLVLKKFFPSFIVNRVQNMISFSFHTILDKEWATPQEIDEAVKSVLGIRLPVVGIAQSQDFTGLDLIYDIQKRSPIRFKCIKTRYARGEYGVKTGKGFYDYKGRSEEEILKKRDAMYLRMQDFIEEIGAFGPV